MQEGIESRPRVLVMGGASGIGRALAEHLAEQGAELILADYDGPALNATAAAVGARGIFCDILSEASIEVFCAYLATRFDSIDMLVNAAGMQYVRTICMVRMSVAMLPLLRRSTKCPQILSVASADHFARPASPFPYASSRESFFRCNDALSKRVSDSRISVSAIVLEDGEATAGATDGQVFERRRDNDDDDQSDGFAWLSRHIVGLIGGRPPSRAPARLARRPLAS